MSEKKEVVESKKVELSKSDNDQLELRKAIITDKQREIQKLNLEAQIFTKEYQFLVKDLFKKYNLDETKEYTINNGFIVEVKKVDKQTSEEE